MLQNKLKIYCTVVKYDFQKDKKRAFIIWVTEGGRVSVILKTVKKKNYSKQGIHLPVTAPIIYTTKKYTSSANNCTKYICYTVNPNKEK